MSETTQPIIIDTQPVGPFITGENGSNPQTNEHYATLIAGIGKSIGELPFYLRSYLEYRLYLFEKYPTILPATKEYVDKIIPHILSKLGSGQEAARELSVSFNQFDGIADAPEEINNAIDSNSAEIRLIDQVATQVEKGQFGLDKVFGEMTPIPENERNKTEIASTMIDLNQAIKSLPVPLREYINDGLNIFFSTPQTAQNFHLKAKVLEWLQFLPEAVGIKDRAEVAKIATTFRELAKYFYRNSELYLNVFYKGLLHDYFLQKNMRWLVEELSLPDADNPETDIYQINEILAQIDQETFDFADFLHKIEPVPKEKYENEVIPLVQKIKNIFNSIKHIHPDLQTHYSHLLNHLVRYPSGKLFHNLYSEFKSLSQNSSINKQTAINLTINLLKIGDYIFAKSSSYRALASGAFNYFISPKMPELIEEFFPSKPVYPAMPLSQTEKDSYWENQPLMSIELVSDKADIIPQPNTRFIVIKPKENRDNNPDSNGKSKTPNASIPAKLENQIITKNGKGKDEDKDKHPKGKKKKRKRGKKNRKKERREKLKQQTEAIKPANPIPEQTEVNHPPEPALTQSQPSSKTTSFSLRIKLPRITPEKILIVSAAVLLPLALGLLALNSSLQRQEARIKQPATQIEVLKNTPQALLGLDLLDIYNQGCIVVYNPGKEKQILFTKKDLPSAGNYLYLRSGKRNLNVNIFNSSNGNYIAKGIAIDDLGIVNDPASTSVIVCSANITTAPDTQELP